MLGGGVHLEFGALTVDGHALDELRRAFPTKLSRPIRVYKGWEDERVSDLKNVRTSRPKSGHISIFFCTCL